MKTIDEILMLDWQKRPSDSMTIGEFKRKSKENMENTKKEISEMVKEIIGEEYHSDEVLSDVDIARECMANAVIRKQLDRARKMGLTV